MIGVLTSRLGAGLLLGLAAVLAFWWHTERVETRAREQMAAELLIQTQAESDRRGAVIDAARKNAERMAETIAANEEAAQLAILGIVHASLENDTSACLDPVAVDRLRQLPTHRSGPGARAAPGGSAP